MVELATVLDSMHGGAAVRPGDTVADKYLVESVLGVGGMGIVYLARHLQLGGRVALKFLSADCLGSAEAIERFRREAQAAAQLHNEHVVRVFDVGTHTNGLPYMVMEYLDGRDLGRIIEHSGPLSIDIAASLLIQTCSALEEAHRHGIIHRDLKPSNLFCVQRSDGTLAIKVVDFGISKVTGQAATLSGGITITGFIIGSPSYMSPEQMKTPNRTDRRSDIWQLGVVLYECLTGKLPFPGSTYAEICLKVHQEPRLPASAHGVELPPGLEAIIDRCLAKEPEQRFQTATELAAALWAYAPHLPRARVPSVPAGDVRERLTPAARAGTPRDSHGQDAFTGTQPGYAQSTAAPGARFRLSLVLSAAALVAAGTVGWLLFRPTANRYVSGASITSALPASAIPSTLVLPEPVSPVPAPVASGEQAEERPAAAKAAPVAPSPQASLGLAPRSSAPPAGSASGRPPAIESKAVVKPPPVRPATERDPKNSVWTR